MSKISVIVPIYNTADKLERCLNSILKQEYEDIEIIAIDDGSKDNPGKIIEKYQKQYPKKIKFYKQDNQGIAKTRNKGIEKSSSDYILFIDSDDYIETDTIKKLEKYIQEDIDLIKFKLQRIDKNGKIIEKVDGPVFENISGEEAFDMLYKKDVLLDSPCIYLIKKKLFTQNNFKFLGKYHEDFGLIPFLIVTAKSVVSTPYYLYNYEQGENSITRNGKNYDKTVERSNQALYQYDKMLEKLSNLKLSKTAIENIKIYYTNAIILKVQELEKREQKEYIKEIKKRKMYKNIKPRNIKQLVKRIILKINIKLYLKLR